MKIDWKRKLSSRKLWISVASFISNILIAAGLSESTVTQVIAIIMAGASCIAYVIAEGLTDAGNVSKPQITTEYNTDDYMAEGERNI